MKIIFSLLFGAVVYGANWIAVLIGWYEKYEWIDIPLHILGGMVAASLGIALLSTTTESITLKKPFKNWSWLWHFTVLISFVCLVAVIWELHEFIIDSFKYGSFYEQLYTERVLGTHQPSVTDTMIDFIMGLVGGTLYFIGQKIYEKNS